MAKRSNQNDLLDAEVEGARLTNTLLKARTQREQALTGLFNTLRDVALDLRDLARKEAGR